MVTSIHINRGTLELNFLHLNFKAILSWLEKQRTASNGNSGSQITSGLLPAAPVALLEETSNCRHLQLAACSPVLLLEEMGNCRPLPQTPYRRHWEQPPCHELTSHCPNPLPSRQQPPSLLNSPSPPAGASRGDPALKTLLFNNLIKQSF